MVSKELQRFCHENPLVYSHAGREDLEQLSRIYELYPDSTRLLSDREAVELPYFDCRRCGECCSAVKYVTVSHGDVKRWVLQKRLDILDELAIDRRKTPLLARRRDGIEAAKAEARAMCNNAGLDSEHVFELLYLTKLLECAVYVKRRDGACAFLAEQDGTTACRIQDTKPGVCDKFPYYLGRYTDGRLLKADSFCPSLREMAINKHIS